MSDNGTLRDHLTDVINERNELLSKVAQLETLLFKRGIELGYMEQRLDELNKQLAALWKVDND